MFLFLVSRCRLDLLFVLDSSSSISSNNFQQILTLIVQIVDQFEIGATATQVGVISFSSTPSTDSPFGINIGTLSDKEQLKQSILSLQQLAESGRRTDLALDVATRTLTSFRTDVPNAVVVISSGASDKSQQSVQAAGLLQLVSDTEVFVIGASAVVDTTSEFLEEVYAIGQDPDSEHVFMIHSFQQQSVNSIFQLLTKELCDGENADYLLSLLLIFFYYIIQIDDSNVRADPIFSVPISGSKHNLELCYEIYGTTNKYFNLVSDRCLSVNAHYTNSEKINHSGRPLHFIDQVSIMAMNNIGHCITTVVEIERNQCLVTVNGAVLRFIDNDKFEASGVEVTLSLSNRVLISVPNCGEEKVLMILSCKLSGLHSGFVEFQIQDGQEIQPSAHGLIGKICLSSMHRLIKIYDLRHYSWHLLSSQVSFGTFRCLWPRKLVYQ